jgi:recombination protein RecA
MRTAAEIRQQIESALAGRIPAALSFRPLSSPELLSCGVVKVDALLGGGLPLGAITELMGTHSSGRTTLALSTLAELTQQGQSCAYVDVCDTLDPLSASALGIDLRRVLWVRLRTGVSDRRAIADPSDQRRKTRCEPSGVAPRLYHSARLDHLARLDHGLRATDLLLSAGGFRALVLDLGDLPPEQVRRVPLATWYRFRLQAEKSRTLLLLITCAPHTTACASTSYAPTTSASAPTAKACAANCAAVSLRFEPASADWRQATLHADAPRLLAGLHYRISLERSRAVDSTRKKPAVSTEAAWSSRTSWAR